MVALAGPRLEFEQDQSYDPRALAVLDTMTPEELSVFNSELVRVWGHMLRKVLEIVGRKSQRLSKEDAEFLHIMSNRSSYFTVAGRVIRVEICPESFHWRLVDIRLPGSAACYHERRVELRGGAET